MQPTVTNDTRTQLHVRIRAVPLNQSIFLLDEGRKRPAGIRGTTVNEQETADRIAVVTQPRLVSLLRLKSTKHVYDPTTGFGEFYVQRGRS